MRKIGERDAAAKAKLLRLLLQESELMTSSKLLEHAKDFQLYDEIIEPNKKLGRHADVLRTLVRDKRSHEEAVRYCMETPPKPK